MWTSRAPFAAQISASTPGASPLIVNASARSVSQRSTFVFAAQLISTQAGFSYASTVDPTTQAFLDVLTERQNAAKIPEKDLNAVLADQATLTAILSHHVVAEQLDPESVVGEHETLNGDMIDIEGDAESGLTVDGKSATVLCGNIPTANATVYVIDSVLMPTT